MITLVQEFGAHAGRTLSFDQTRVRLGRAPDNDVVFDAHTDLDASAHHCEVVCESGGWFLVDSNSRNGTYLNGQRVAREALRAGDRLSCGRNGPRIRFETNTPAGANGPKHPADLSLDNPELDLARRQRATRLMLLASVVLLLVSFAATVYLVLVP